MDGHGHHDGDGWLVGGLQHGLLVASLLQMSALGDQASDLRDLVLILFQLYGKLNENRPVPAFSSLTGATKKMRAAEVRGWRLHTEKCWGSY